MMKFHEIEEIAKLYADKETNLYNSREEVESIKRAFTEGAVWAFFYLNDMHNQAKIIYENTPK